MFLHRLCQLCCCSDISNSMHCLIECTTAQLTLDPHAKGIRRAIFVCLNEQRGCAVVTTDRDSILLSPAPLCLAPRGPLEGWQWPAVAAPATTCGPGSRVYLLISSASMQHCRYKDSPVRPDRLFALLAVLVASRYLAPASLDDASCTPCGYLRDELDPNIRLNSRTAL